MLADGKTIRASELALRSSPAAKTLPADAASLRAGDRFAGKRIAATLASQDGTLRVRWQAVLRDGDNYVRQD